MPTTGFASLFGAGPGAAVFAARVHYARCPNGFQEMNIVKSCGRVYAVRHENSTAKTVVDSGGIALAYCRLLTAKVSGRNRPGGTQGSE